MKQDLQTIEDRLAIIAVLLAVMCGAVLAVTFFK